MESPTGIIPDELMSRRKKREVKAWLAAQPFTGDYKRRLLEGWQIWVGIRLHGRDFQDVQATGIDQPGRTWSRPSGVQG